MEEENFQVVSVLENNYWEQEWENLQSTSVKPAKKSAITWLCCAHKHNGLYSNHDCNAYKVPSKAEPDSC